MEYYLHSTSSLCSPLDHRLISGALSLVATHTVLCEGIASLVAYTSLAL